MRTLDWTLNGVHVDDSEVWCDKEESFDRWVQALQNFGLTALRGDDDYFLGLNTRYDRNEGVLYISHRSYWKKLLKVNGYGARLNNPATGKIQTAPVPWSPGKSKNLDRKESEKQATPEEVKRFRSGLGGLVHMGNYSSPDIAVHISELPQRMHDPTAMCQELLGGLYRYKELTVNAERRLQPNVDQVSDQGEIDLFLMSDANLGIHRDKCRARAGVLAFLADVLVCWQSKLEPGQSAATAKSEFIGMANAAGIGLWIDSLVIDISQGRYFIKKPIICAADNQAAITIAKSAALTKMARHIDIRWM